LIINYFWFGWFDDDIYHKIINKKSCYMFIGYFLAGKINEIL